MFDRALEAYRAAVVWWVDTASRFASRSHIPKVSADDSEKTTSSCRTARSVLTDRLGPRSMNSEVEGDADKGAGGA